MDPKALAGESNFEDYLDTEDGVIAKKGRGKRAPSACALIQGKGKVFLTQTDESQELDDKAGSVEMGVYFRDDKYTDKSRDIGIYKATLVLPEGISSFEKQRFLRNCKRYVLQQGHLYEIQPLSGPAHKVPRRVVGLPALRKRILSELHNRAGHKGREGTYTKLIERYTWPKMYSEVEKYVESCEECQKRARKRYSGPTHPQYSDILFG